MCELRRLADIIGYSLHARDGEIGKLRQVYFDDERWTVRYFVVHTGSWLLGRDVLVVPAVVSAVDEADHCLQVDLTREQIQNSPSVGTELPVSRHYEQEYYRYYGWEPYWSGDPLLGPMPPVMPPADGEAPRPPAHPHLRSSAEVSGYRIHAQDGEIGRVSDFVLEDPGWAVRYLEVDIGSWLTGKTVLLAPAWIENIDWSGHEVVTTLSCDAIRTAPAYDPSAIISRDYQVALYKHYGRRFVED